MNSSPNWIDFVIPNHRTGFLSLLDEISQYQDTVFVLIGAGALLIQGILKYRAIWDIDLIFEDQKHLEGFLNSINGEYTRLDDRVVVSKSIMSFKTAWKRHGVWFNVDLISKGVDYYRLFNKDVVDYHQSIGYDNQSYGLTLPLANYMAILVDKLTSPRLIRDLNQGSSLGADLRHVIIIVMAHQGDGKFYEHLEESGRLLNKWPQVIKNLKRIVEQAGSIGYQYFKPAPQLISFLKRW